MPLEKIKTGGLHTAWLLSPPGVIRSHAPHLPGRRPSSAVYHFGGYEPYYQVLLTHGSPGKDIADKDNPIHSSGEAKDWTPFKEGIQARADSHETTWLFEGGRSLVLPKKKVLYQTNQGQDWHPGCAQNGARAREGGQTGFQPCTHFVKLRRQQEAGVREPSCTRVEASSPFCSSSSAGGTSGQRTFEHPTKETAAQNQAAQHLEKHCGLANPSRRS